MSQTHHPQNVTNTPQNVAPQNGTAQNVAAQNVHDQRMVVTFLIFEIILIKIRKS